MARRADSKMSWTLWAELDRGAPMRTAILFELGPRSTLPGAKRSHVPEMCTGTMGAPAALAR